MLKWIYCGVMLLPLMVGACSPNSTEQYEEGQAVVPEAQRMFAAYVNHGLDQANRSLTELEEETEETAAKSDAMVDQTVSHLRNEYEELSADADSLVGAQDAKLDEQKLALRERLTDLTRTVERTRLEIYEDPKEFKEEAQLRLTELDKRLYQLRTNIENEGLEARFDSTLAKLDRLREEASKELNDLENTAAEKYRENRGHVTTALTTLTVTLTEAESEYQTVAGEDMMPRNENGNPDSMSSNGQVEPIDQSQ